MDVFLDNFYFIWLNSFLALVAVLFGWLMSKANSIFAKIWTGFMWLIFLPNTIYILTDISHIFENWPKVDNLFKFILIIQYGLFSIFGILSFVIAIYFFQKLLERKSTPPGGGWRRKKVKSTTFITIFILNFIVGFGVVLGGIQRTHSFYIFTDPIRVAQDILDMISSKEMLMLSVGVGLFANVLYFLSVETIATWGKKLFKK